MAACGQAALTDSHAASSATAASEGRGKSLQTCCRLQSGKRKEGDEDSLGTRAARSLPLPRTPQYLADVHGGHLGGTHGRVARRVGQGLAGAYGQLLLLPRGNNLLGN